jgi:TonB family protein
MKNPTLVSCGVIFSVLLSLFSTGALIAQPAPPAGPVQADFGEASLHDWVQPAYPEAARKAKAEARVVVEFMVDPAGRVTKAEIADSTNPVFNEAALEAVRRWTFAPALENGQPVASGMIVPILFQLTQLKQKQAPLAPPSGLMPHAARVIPAKFKAAPDPDYPAELEEKKIPGQVLIEFTVDPEGSARAPKVIWASHAAFVEMALRALEKTKFEPARQGLLTKASTMQYPVEFGSMGVKRPEILAANQLTLIGETNPQVEPVPFVLIEPVYPREHLLAGEEGTATAEFTVDGKGNTTEVTLVSASAPEYGAALVAAVEAWGFKPASTDGNQVPARLRVVHGFVPPTSGSNARLVEAIRPGGAGVGGASGLDQKLKPLWRGFPVYPAAFKDAPVVGSAEIEFIIDQDGRARLPRVRKATHEEFGWAAATAISQWVFERPIRKGEPVDVKVVIPFDFTPPKS